MKTISWWDKFLVCYIGIIPNKPEVKTYLRSCAEKREFDRIISSYVQRVK